jgi:hypothetical protein
MKRFLFVAGIAALLLTVGAVATLAAPEGPGWGMMGRLQGGTDGYGHMGGWGMPWHGMMGDGDMMHDDMMHDDLEELLGIGEADIHAAMVEGKSLVHIAAEKGVSEAQLTQALLDGRKAALDRAVENGRLTQTQADEMYGFMETNIKAMVNTPGIASMHGARGIMGRFGMGLGGMMGGYGTAPCHGNQAPAEQGRGTRNNTRYAPDWSQQS